MDQQKPVLNYTPLKLPLHAHHDSPGLPLPILLGLVVLILGGVGFLGFIFMRTTYFATPKDDKSKYSVTNNKNLAATVAAAAANGPSGAPTATLMPTMAAVAETATPEADVTDAMEQELVATPTLIPVVTTNPTVAPVEDEEL